MMQKKLKRRNHYLPKCYQMGFADSSDLVWVRFARDGSLKHLSPDSVGAEHDLYIWTKYGIKTDDVETFFGEAVEDRFALLSQRIKEQKDKFRDVNLDDLANFCCFVASQAVRTVAHRSCVEEQAKGPVGTNRFVQVVLEMMGTITGYWGNNPPNLHFSTFLPLVGEQFITGDNPVVVLTNTHKVIAEPISQPTRAITSVHEILRHPNYEFVVPLSPYICLSVQQGNGTHAKAFLPPSECTLAYVKRINGFIRGQSEVFVLAKDKEFLYI